VAMTEAAFASLALDHDAVERVVALALAEDVGSGDVTTESTVDADARCRAELVVEEDGVVCGLPVAAAVFSALDERVSLERRIHEGERVAPDTVVAELEGPARALLTGERTALNLLARLSGIATLTSRYVDAVAGTRAHILDTRKTTPGLRALEKYAVRCGGGVNHRLGLHDAVLVKENHIRAAGSITAAVDALRRLNVALPVEVEAETFADIREAFVSGVERILLDNMTPDEVLAAVELVAGRAQLEASGGITLENVRAFAEAGVDFISIGALTHSVRSLHVSLEVR
jgi:nicotinate-nucleotide pyrophosphorylase (carboxylating)